MFRRRKSEDAHRITTASVPRSDEIDSRQKRYLISMGIRTLCFIAAALSIGHWFAWLFLVGALILPYFAVIAANVGTNTDPEPLPPVDLDRRELPGSDSK